MRLRDHYDWIVIGDHPAGIFSAALVARLGLSSLVLPAGKVARSRLMESGQVMDFERNWVPGIGATEAGAGWLSSAWKRAGGKDAEALGESAPNPLTQVLTQSSRVALSADPQSLGRELAREWGEARALASGLPEALGRVDSLVLGHWADWTEQFRVNAIAPEADRRKSVPKVVDLEKLIERELQKAGSPEAKRWARSACPLTDPDQRAILQGLIYGSGGPWKSHWSSPALLEQLILGRSGGSVRGGMTGLRDRLGVLAKRCGAHLPERASAEEILLEEGRFRGVRIHGEANPVVGGAAFLGGELAPLLPGLGSSEPGLTPPVAWTWTLAFTVHSEAIPPGMGSRWVWSEEHGPPLEVEVADPTDYGVDEPEHRLVFVRTELPFREETLTVDYQRTIAARMMKKITEVIPFLEYHVVRVLPDFRSSKDTFTPVYGYRTLEEIPGNLRVRGAGRGSARTGGQSWFVASTGAKPERGLLGPWMAAVESVAWLAHKNGLPGPFGPDVPDQTG